MLSQINSTPIETLSFRPALKALALIIILVVVGISLALAANSHRRQVVIEAYTSQTLAHYQTNQAAYQTFFERTFADCQKELAVKNASEAAGFKSSDLPCQAAQHQLATMRVDQLPDSSAIAYVTIVNDTYELIEASGKYNQSRSLFDTNQYNHFGYEQQTKQDLARYFKDRSDILLWQDFIHYIGGKEVLVPITTNHQPIGYVFRGVIER